MLKLQSNITPALVQRRMREHYGERPTVKDATRRVLGSMFDWGVIKQTSSKGVYRIGKSFPLKEQDIIAWLIEACLHSQPNGATTVDELLENASLFPFILSHYSAEKLSSMSPRLEILRHSLDANLIRLKKN